MGVYIHFMVCIFMGSNLSLRGVWKFRNMKCSRSDSRPILGLLRVSS